jgi:hypothetical protein
MPRSYGHTAAHQNTLPPKIIMKEGTQTANSDTPKKILQSTKIVHKKKPTESKPMENHVSQESKISAGLKILTKKKFVHV